MKKRDQDEELLLAKPVKLFIHSNAFWNLSACVGLKDLNKQQRQAGQAVAAAAAAAATCLWLITFRIWSRKLETHASWIRSDVIMLMHATPEN